MPAEKPYHTVTSNHQEFIVRRDIMHHHVGKCSHDLLFGRKVGTFLEFKISNRSRQSKVAIDAAKVYKPASSCNASLFAYSP